MPPHETVVLFGQLLLASALALRYQTEWPEGDAVEGFINFLAGLLILLILLCFIYLCASLANRTLSLRPSPSFPPCLPFASLPRTLYLPSPPLPLASAFPCPLFLRLAQDSALVPLNYLLHDATRRSGYYFHRKFKRFSQENAIIFERYEQLSHHATNIHDVMERTIVSSTR